MALLRKPFQLETAFDHFLAVEKIGEGGAGRVFRVEQERGPDLAAKILSPDRLNSKRLRRFKNEYRFCEASEHPNIIRVFGSGLHEYGGGTVPFFLMDLFSGSLRSRLSKLDASQAMKVFAAVLDGIEAAHNDGVVHRDLKPENVLLDDDLKRIVVADFGIARFTREELYTAVETRAADRLANFVYAAPEQRVRGRDTDRRTDIYALGLLLNELFTGEVPQGVNYRTIASVDEDHAYLDEIVEAMIQQSPDDRPESIAAVKKLLLARKSAHVRLQKLSEFRNRTIPKHEIDDVVYHNLPTGIDDADWDGRILTLILDQPVNDEWVQSLRRMGGYSAVYGKGPDAFSFRGKKATVNASEHEVQSIVNHFKNWLPRANAVYRERIERQVRESARRAKKRLQEEYEAEQRRVRLLENLDL